MYGTWNVPTTLAFVGDVNFGAVTEARDELTGCMGICLRVWGGVKPVQIEVSAAPLTSDAGLLPVRQFDERIGFTGRLAAAMGDRRDPNAVDHMVRTMLRQRVYGMLAGYEDQNDHDTLRHDPVFQLICDKTPVTCRDGTSERAVALAQWHSLWKVAGTWNVPATLPTK